VSAKPHRENDARRPGGGRRDRRNGDVSLTLPLRKIEVKRRMDEGSQQLLMATFAYLLVLGGIIATVGLLAGA
jgi:hypothetical protein